VPNLLGKFVSSLIARLGVVISWSLRSGITFEKILVSYLCGFRWLSTGLMSSCIVNGSSSMLKYARFPIKSSFRLPAVDFFLSTMPTFSDSEMRKLYCVLPLMMFLLFCWWDVWITLELMPATLPWVTAFGDMRSGNLLVAEFVGEMKFSSIGLRRLKVLNSLMSF